MIKIPERAAAHAAGERYYFTGKPCKSGHVAKRYTQTGVCSICATTNTKRTQAKKHEQPERTEARVVGLSQYRAGFQCKHGHEDLRFVSSGRCVSCNLIWNRKYFKERPGLEAAHKRTLRAKDPRSHRKASCKWVKNNPQKAREIQKRTIARNPTLWRKRFVVYTQTRKTRMLGNGGSFTDKDIDTLFVRQSGACLGCKRTDVKLTVDHIIAVSNGGSSDPSNLQLLCRRCNTSKGRKNFEEWIVQRHHDLFKQPATQN